MNRVSAVALGAVSLLVGLPGVGLALYVQPGGDGVLARTVAPDGSEFLVEQTCNGDLEPYTVDFYLRAPGGDWGWCYLDHEAVRWRDVELRYDPVVDQVIVLECGARRAVLDRRTGTFRLDSHRTGPGVAAPQEQRAPSHLEPG